jgi:hypothetical protein
MPDLSSTLIREIVEEASTPREMGPQLTLEEVRAAVVEAGIPEDEVEAALVSIRDEQDPSEGLLPMAFGCAIAALVFGTFAAGSTLSRGDQLGMWGATVLMSLVGVGFLVGLLLTWPAHKRWRRRADVREFLQRELPTVAAPDSSSSSTETGLTAAGPLGEDRAVG